LQHLLLPYVADLELEVDRLRRHNHLLRQEARALLQQLPAGGAADAVGEGTSLPGIVQAAEHFAGVLRDLREAPGYHPHTTWSCSPVTR
jgi:hypothetical protein